MGKDATDYGAISRSIGGQVGDGGQFELSRGEIDVTHVKKRWLFNLATDPTEHHDLQHEHPGKVQELLARMTQLQNEQAPPFQSGAMNYFRSEKVAGRKLPLGKYFAVGTGTASDKHKSVLVDDFHTYEGFPKQGRLLMDGEPARLLGAEDLPQKSRL